LYIVIADHTVVDCQRQQSATSLSRLTVSRIVVDRRQCSHLCRKFSACIVMHSPR